MTQEGAFRGESLLSKFVRDAFRDAVVVIDDQGFVLDCNRAARGARGLDVVSLFENGRNDPRLTGYLAELRARQEYTLELELLTGTGTGRVGLFALDGAVIDGRCVIVVRDRTERQTLDEEVLELRRVQALGFVTASVIHDFNNLMVPILCLSELLTKELGEGGSAASLATEVHYAAERAASLVRDVHALTRARSATREPVDLSAVVLDMKPLIERMLAGKIELSLALEATLGDALVDRERLEHALLNLIANAREAMQHGGRLTITTANVAFVAGASNDDGSEAPSYVALVVEDTGVGMTDAVRARVFDRFYTTRDGAGGTGLGLASVKRFVNDSGGLLALHSEPGRGTLVTIHLPRAGRKERPTSPDLGRADASGNGETILVVDEDEPVRRTVKAVLEARGYRVIGAASAEDALRAAACRKSPIDLALIDTALSDTDYPSFLERLEAAAGGAGVLLMSAAAEQGELVSDAAGDRTLKKAFSIQELVQKTRSALDAAPERRPRSSN